MDKCGGSREFDFLRSNRTYILDRRAPDRPSNGNRERMMDLVDSCNLSLPYPSDDNDNKFVHVAPTNRTCSRILLRLLLPSVYRPSTGSFLVINGTQQKMCTRANRKVHPYGSMPVLLLWTNLNSTDITIQCICYRMVRMTFYSIHKS